MGLIRRLLGLGEQRNAAWGPLDPRWYATLGPVVSGGMSWSDSTALGSTAVWCANQVLCDSVAMLPLKVYLRRADGGRRKTPDTSHPLYALLHDEPNPEQTSFEFRWWMQANLNIRGNAYAWIERARGGRVLALWPLLAAHMEVDGDLRNGLRYRYRGDGREWVIPQEDVLHLRGPWRDGLVGLAGLRQCADALSVGVAQDRYAAAFYRNGSAPQGTLESPETPRDPEDASKRVRQNWQEIHGGPDRAHRIAILWAGMQYKPMGVTPADSQLVDARQFSITEVARVFLIPPHRLMELSHATFSNIEHQGIEFVQYSLQPWLSRWEQRLAHDVFSEADRATHFAEFVVDGLLRGDIKSRYEAYQTGVLSGFMTPNEVRDLENLEPVDGGDTLLVPVNMQPLERALSGPAMDAGIEPSAGAGEEGLADAEENAE